MSRPMMIWLSAVALIAGAAGPALAGDFPGFSDPMFFEAGEGARGLDVGDFDGDGVVDLVIAASNQPAVNVLLGVGDGTFKQGPTTPIDGPWDLVAADFDGDGDPDVAVVQPTLNRVAVLMNNGDGTLQVSQLPPVGAQPQNIEAGDLDDDGDVDLVTANVFSANVSVLLNQGDGVFGNQTQYAAEPNPFDLELSDLDGNGSLDIITMNTLISDTMTLRFNDGRGAFPTSETFDIGSTTDPVAAADFDGDGDNDLAMGADNVWTLVNLGRGVFVPHTVVSLNSSGIIDLHVADFNADGTPDLALGKIPVNAVETGSAQVLIGVPGLILSEPEDLTGDGEVDGTDLGILLLRWGESNIGDANLDGTIDGADIGLLLGEWGRVDIAQQWGFTLGDDNFPFEVKSADVDGDGDVDLIVSAAAPAKVAVFLNAMNDERNKPVGD